MSLINECNRLIGVKNDLTNSLFNKGIFLVENTPLNKYSSLINNLLCPHIYIATENAIFSNKSGSFSYKFEDYGLLNNIYISNGVTNISYTFSKSEVQSIYSGGNDIIDMSYAYNWCRNFTGSPVCGNSVVNMSGAYNNCRNLTGSPVCGDNVIDMSKAYMLCSNLTGSPVCGNNVVNMVNAYSGCSKLTGTIVCGENVTNMSNAYNNCQNIIVGNAYIYSSNILDYKGVFQCFNNKNARKRLNLYVPSNSLTLNACIDSQARMTGRAARFTDDLQVNGCYYNKSVNLYIYPVENVAAAQEQNGG